MKMSSHLLGLKRSGLKNDIQNLVPVEFKSLVEIDEIVVSAARQEFQIGIRVNLVLDASTMPRRLIFQLLEHIAAHRPRFEGAFLAYNHPRR